MIFKCLTCPTKYKAFKSEGRKYCSLKCAAIGRSYIVNGNCGVCGRKIKDDGRPRKYCDKICDTVNKRRLGAIKRTTQCHYCKEFFLRRKSEKRKYCNYKCSAKSKIKKK